MDESNLQNKSDTLQLSWTTSKKWYIDTLKPEEIRIFHNGTDL